MKTNPLQDFDFLAEPIDKPEPKKHEPLVPVVLPPGPNLEQVAKMTPRKFAQSVLNVYERLGEDGWLYKQAHIDPKGFMELLKKMIPRSITAEDLGSMYINLIDQFGNKIEMGVNDSRGSTPPVSAASATSGGPAQLGQPRTATGGTPKHPEPEVTIVDEF